MDFLAKRLVLIVTGGAIKLFGDFSEFERSEAVSNPSDFFLETDVELTSLVVNNVFGCSGGLSSLTSVLGTVQLTSSFCSGFGEIELKQ